MATLNLTEILRSQGSPESVNYKTVYELKEILAKYQNIETTKKGNTYYYELPLSFDIETSSFLESNQLDKTAIMYEWTFGICYDVIIGRTWYEFEYLYETLIDFFNTSDDLRIIIYVHNLSYEFQFLRKRFSWSKIFSLKKREPIQAITTDGIEFRCSYLLSGYPLRLLSNQLDHYIVHKMDGDLDYSLIRNSKTQLTDKEIRYCINDVLVVNSYIAETIERLGTITKIPLTKTGYVREYCRDMCLYKDDNKYGDKFKNYRRIMNNLKLDSDIYSKLKQAFAGGFTHAGIMYSNEIMEKVGSFDFTSSYPYVMISEKFPMSKGKKVKIKNDKDLDMYLRCYCCLFGVRIKNIKPKKYFEQYISQSKCTLLQKPVSNNGRLISADLIDIEITEQDYYIIKEYYDWEEITYYDFYIFEKAYLPKDFVLSILKLYYDKTTLKDVKGKEIEYLLSKEKINSCYGMMVTDICRDNIKYNNDEWIAEKTDIEKAIDIYNKSIKRVLYYPWGIWVTAYARRNLFTGISEFAEDYIYSDTDSIKAINIEKHQEYINKYNKEVIEKLRKVMSIQGIDFNLTAPKNIKGVTKQIGIWSFEGVYDRFKTLGAKRYMTEKDNKISITVSGLNKEIAVPYLMKNFGDKIFEKFDDQLYIPPEYTGKKTHTYIDVKREGIIKDYTGIEAEYEELSSVHLENAEYTLSITEEYAKLIQGVKSFTK